MTQKIYTDDWRLGIELKYEPYSTLQTFYYRGNSYPSKGDLILTKGPEFVITTVTRISSGFYSGRCRTKRNER